MCYIIKSMTFSFKSKIIQIYKKKNGILYKWFRITWLLFSMEWQHKEHIYNIKASYKFIDNHIVKSFIQFPLKIISNVFWPFFPIEWIIIIRISWNRFIFKLFFIHEHTNVLTKIVELFWCLTIYKHNACYITVAHTRWQHSKPIVQLFRILTYS